MRLPFSTSLSLICASIAATAATPDRITTPVDSTELKVIAGSVHRLAQPQYDRGPAAADLQLDHVLIMIRPSAEQQSDLDQLLANQQNPASANYRQWLTPESYADRFGLTTGDHAKIAAWLSAEGLTVQDSSRGRNWIAFAGSASQVSKALHTSIHTYSVNGVSHFANATEPSVPEAIAGVVAGFAGLNDFRVKSNARIVAAPWGTPGSAPNDTNGSGQHALAPGDFTTIYDVKPLYAAGIDGTGQSIAIVGQSDILLSDLSTFRSEFGLAPMAPKQVLYGTDPGYNAGDALEANLDLEWSGVIAQKATLYYVYGQDAITAWSVAVSSNFAPVISISFGGCEVDDPNSVFRTVAQQANAQGITTLAASGDSAAAGCDLSSVTSVATSGPSVEFPSSIPEVTAVGGTMFNEGSGTYWSSTNASFGVSALSYIPEIAWNQSSLSSGIQGGGGGASTVFPKPGWQTGPGVPADGVRDVPDLALSASLHDPYLVNDSEYGGLIAVGGTSCATPSMAGIVALLNHYQVKQGYQKTAGLGNINPQLYRLAQSAPGAFHDVTGGSNIVPCELGTQGCVTGSFGYSSVPGYDQATGLGSVDANVLVTSWNTAVSGTNLTLTSSASQVTINSTVTLTATVTSATGQGTPTGTVSFLGYAVPLGSATLAPVNGVPTASVTFQAWMLGKGPSYIYATYSGDGAFSGAGGTVKILVTLPTAVNVAAVVPSVADNPIYAYSSTLTEPPAWQANITLSELAGVPAVVTGFTIDGQTQTLSQYFPSANIPAGGTLQTTIELRNLAVPAVKVFGFSGTDAGGNQWSKTIPIQFLGPFNGYDGFNQWAAPLTMLQNTSAPSSCQWSQRLLLDGTSYQQQIIGLYSGSVNLSSNIASIFGTTRLAPWGTVQGTICWSGENVPSTDFVNIATEDDFGDIFTASINVSFAGPPASAVTLSASPASLTLKPSSAPLFQPPVTLSVSLSDKTQPWTATVYPANQTTAWLQLSQYSGTGPATITLERGVAGFAPGAYKATILLQSPLATPEWVSIPVMWVNSSSPQGPVVTSLGNAATLPAGRQPRNAVGDLWHAAGEYHSDLSNHAG